MFNSACDKNPLTNTHKRDDKIMHQMFKEANIPLPKDKAHNFPTRVGISGAEAKSSTSITSAEGSKHVIGDKLNACQMTQVLEKTMHGASSFFVKPDFEP